METIVLVIHLLLALAIIGLVLMQRSSGGGLGIGGGGGMGDFASARGAANTMTRMTTYFAIAFFGTSLTLAYLAGHNKETSVLDALETDEIAIELPIDVEMDQPEVPVGE